MLDIQSLERRWLRYKLKVYLPYTAIIMLCILGYGAYSFLMTDQNPENSHIQLPSKTPTTSSLPPPSPSTEVVLEPSMNFMQNIEPFNASESPAPAIIKPAAQKETVALPPVAVQGSLPKETVFQSQPPPKDHLPNKSITNEIKAPVPIVKRDETPLNINELQTRFQSNANPNLGVFIARYHYDHGNYPEAYNYALKTNAINNKMEESWLIFAKSLIKMGKMDQAKKTLQLYISQSNSENAKNLLDSLEKDIKK